MFYSFNGLSALPSNPAPVVGKTWVAYTNGPNTQWTSCPPKPPFGCFIIGGYAWGQRSALPGDEFAFKYIAPVPISSAPTGTAANIDQITQQCATMWSDWAQKNPAEYKCLTARQSQKLVELCVAWKSGKLSFSDYSTRVKALREAACIRDGCRRELAPWLAQLPGGGKCVTAADRNNIVDWCVAAKTGAITEKRYLRRTHDLIITHCKPAPSGGGGSTPTPTDVLPSGGPVHDEGDGGLVEAPSLLRQWGPVVGIGLLIALGLTVASQSKGKKRHARA